MKSKFEDKKFYKLKELENSTEISYFTTKYNLIFLLTLSPVIIILMWQIADLRIQDFYIVNNIRTLNIQYRYPHPLDEKIALAVSVISIVPLFIWINKIKVKTKKLIVATDYIIISQKNKILRDLFFVIFILITPVLLSMVWHLGAKHGLKTESNFYELGLYAMLVFLVPYIYFVKWLVSKIDNLDTGYDTETFATKDIEYFVINKPLTQQGTAVAFFYVAGGRDRVEKIANTSASTIGNAAGAFFVLFIFAMLYGISYRLYRVRVHIGKRNRSIINGLSKKKAKVLYTVLRETMNKQLSEMIVVS